MNNNSLISPDIVNSKISELGLSDLGVAKIREIVKLVNQIQEISGEKFIRMEMGVPGLQPAAVGTEAEIEALKRGVASSYANIEGVPEFKYEVSRFVKLFMDLDVSPES